MPGLLELVIILLVAFVLVFPFWKISTKAGFPGWFSLAMVIPGLNMLFPFFLAFADWPSLREQRTTPTE